ncbi:MAG: superoxide dismutase, Ni [Gammaproteobacteria bacterium]|nr:MAG: superoxide dismutase, Ni [Gammaproteobacteria bacterium]
MIHKILSGLDKLYGFRTASAHCDVPCGIYDPSTSQIAALTVIRMLDLINELAEKETLTIADQARLSRLVSQKEEHAEKVKAEVRIIWGDYFKQAQFDQVSGVNELVHSIMLQGSKCRQTIDQDNGPELLKLVNQFAEAFWQTKGVETVTATCPYPPAQLVVYPKLG